ncbi:fas-binding factor 1 homolog [Rhynochetos jubatus]
MAEPLLSVALRGRRDTGPGNPGSPVGGQRAAPLGPMPNEEMDVSNLEGSSASDVDPQALLQALKLASSANGRLSWEMREEVRPAELLGRSSVAKLLEQPGTGERREFKLGEKSQKQPEKEEGRHEEDFVFGTYQPTVASLPRARLTRRQPASGFSAENSSEPKPEPQSKPPPAASRSSVQSGRAGSDWLGLKDDFMESELSSPAKASPVTTPRAHLQAAAQLQLCKDTSACQAALLSTQARVAELESQVRMLELERTQHKLLLESLQQRRQEELDLLESTHRSQMKVMEETYRQREQRLRQEKEQLAAQLLSQSQDAERARAELVARQQQHVATLEQQSRLELERLQELHRVSIQEMRKDHEEQLQRLKRLKDQEIDAVTSATLHTRSLNRVTEQMEKFSSDLHKLLQKAEATHHTASQELTMEARQRDRQLKVLQDRLLQQQKDMEEEGSRRQEVIAKMEARQSQLAELKIRGRELKAKEEQLARDRELLDKASQELRLEREKVNRAERSIWQREEEMESMKKLFSQKYEEGEQALREASRMESKSQARLQVMQQHLEQLKQQEQRLHQERLSMAHQRRQLEQLREQLPSNPVRLLTADQGLELLKSIVRPHPSSQEAAVPCR